MTPQDQYHLLAVSNAEISGTADAKLKGKLLIEVATKLDQKYADLQAEKEAEEAKGQAEEASESA